MGDCIVGMEDWAPLEGRDACRRFIVLLKFDGKKLVKTRCISNCSCSSVLLGRVIVPYWWFQKMLNRACWVGSWIWFSKIHCPLDHCVVGLLIFGFLLQLCFPSPGKLLPDAAIVGTNWCHSHGRMKPRLCREYPELGSVFGTRYTERIGGTGLTESAFSICDSRYMGKLMSSGRNYSFEL